MSGVTVPRGRVLIVAGSDSGGGAGIQADIKTVSALGGFAMTAITALTAQNTEGVHGVHAVPPDFVQQQMRVVLDDLGADVIKIGMLGTAPIIEAVADMLEAEGAGIPVVLDPVMVAKGGHPLLDPEAMAAMRERLLPRALIVSPNAPEAEALSGMPVRTSADMEAAAQAIRVMGPRAVLAKGGHLAGGAVVDLLVREDGVDRFESPRVDSRNTHGTGCTLASAVAAGLARGLSLHDAVARARDYVLTAISTAPDLGRGHGPLNHLHTVRLAP